MKNICPNEAQYLDPSLQVRVKFRFGGIEFPPSIYYKIFTHGPVIDLNAFAPRHYALERALKMEQAVGGGAENSSAKAASSARKRGSTEHLAGLVEYFYRRSVAEASNGWRKLEFTFSYCGGGSAGDAGADMEDGESSSFPSRHGVHGHVQIKSGANSLEALEELLLYRRGSRRSERRGAGSASPRRRGTRAKGGDAAGLLSPEGRMPRTPRTAPGKAGFRSPKRVYPDGPEPFGSAQKQVAWRRKRERRKMKWLESLVRAAKTLDELKASEEATALGATGGQLGGPAGSPRAKGVNPADMFIDLANMEQVVVGETGQADAADQLLKWSARLDFDAYIDEWGELGASHNSEGNMRVNMSTRDRLRVREADSDSELDDSGARVFGAQMRQAAFSAGGSSGSFAEGLALHGARAEQSRAAFDADMFGEANSSTSPSVRSSSKPLQLPVLPGSASGPAGIVPGKAASATSDSVEAVTPKANSVAGSVVSSRAQSRHVA